jgi:hypothetical protein
LNAYVASLASLFNTKRLIKGVQGTEVRIFYDSASTKEIPSPSTLSIGAIELPTYQSKKATDAATTVMNALTSTSEFSNVPVQLREYVLTHILCALGILTNKDYVRWEKNQWTVKLNYIDSNQPNYTVLPKLWKTIGTGTTWGTYSYLDLSTSNQTALLAELKKADSKSGYAIYCS